MPSSMIFVSLVAIWLLILVPAVARRRQEVARPSAAALSGRVLARPGHERRSQEVALMDRTDEGSVATTVGETRDGEDTGTATDEVEVPRARESVDRESVDRESVDREDGATDEFDGSDTYGGGDVADGYDAVEDGESWERPPARYRPGRGGFDPEAAALVARARYAARQRIVLGLLGGLLISVLLALFVASGLWWLTALFGVSLVGYLVYLRRQVRMEEAIRARRAARAAGTRRPAAADDPALDEWAARGRTAGRRDEHEQDDEDDELDRAGADLDADGGWVDADHGEPVEPEGEPADAAAGLDDDGDPTRVKGVGEPVGVLPAKRRTVKPEEADDVEPETALPRLKPTPPPPLPAGTTVVELDEEELELGELDHRAGPGYRRAVGQ